MPKFIPDNRGRKRTLEQKKKYSEVFRQNFKEGIRKSWNKGKKGLQISKRKGRRYLEISGNKHWQWKGGISPLRTRVWSSFQYRQWRSDVFNRDNFTYQECSKRGGNIEAHHIKSFAEIIKEYQVKIFDDALECRELWDTNNGITLYKKCHNIKTYGKRKQN